METIWNVFKNPTDLTNFNSIVTLISISISIAIIALPVLIFALKNRDKIGIIFLRLLSSSAILENDYYSSKFVVDKINKSKSVIRILCVRNIRITEPDVIEAFRAFLLKPKSKLIELYTLCPNTTNDCVINDIMCVLPSPPRDVEDFRTQIKTNRSHILNLYESLGTEQKNKIYYYEFPCVPLIHMCQFDETIYMGFQLFNRNKVEESLLKYSIVIKVKSKLGQKIINQFEYLKNKSQNLFKMSREKIST